MISRDFFGSSQIAWKVIWKSNFLFHCQLLPRSKRIFLLKEEAKKELFFLFKIKIALGTSMSCYVSLRFRLRTYFLNFLQPSSWNNIDRRKWWESWSLQMDVGILLGRLVVNRSKIHSYLVKPHHASNGGAKGPV